MREEGSEKNISWALQQENKIRIEVGHEREKDQIGSHLTALLFPVLAAVWSGVCLCSSEGESSNSRSSSKSRRRERVRATRICLREVRWYRTLRWRELAPRRVWK